jgi:hypothetical protein
MAELGTRLTPRHVRSLPVVAVVLATATIVAFSLRGVLGPVGAVVATLLAPSTFLVATIASVRAARRARPERAIARFWWLLGVSHVAVALGAVGLSADLARDGTLRLTTIVPFIVASVLVLVAIVSLPLPLPLRSATGPWSSTSRSWPARAP